ncbi:hypothetical protein K503DRAFT_556784 [Rhizopogon vinicolor AM-OR11-026]|uniref:DUF6533 domain-containing protein n=1 Tax=Rhizopogon vinicolor AM-OR11-026 TaxID=1314800 RepID=A0A1B7MKE1_9AGAM|nr:hypothetical protein K503DRAFT_556784 [Rhizopogon vinicolor AM-OR11-026]
MATTVADVLVLQIVKYTNVAAAGLLIFDYCITFGDEVLWTIGRRWGIPSFVFIMSRYAPFIGAAMTAYAGVKSRQGENCIPFNNISNAAHFVGIIGSEVLLLLRTYIFWECSKKFLVVMVPFSVLFSIMAVVFGTAPIPFGIPGSSPACILEGSRSSTLPYGVLLLYELVLMALTLFKRYHHFKNFRSSVIQALYHDGILYMICITLITTTNVVIDAALPAVYSDLLNTPQVVIHSVLASRILFNLRNTANNLGDEPIFVSSPNFRIPSQFESVEV